MKALWFGFPLIMFVGALLVPVRAASAPLDSGGGHPRPSSGLQAYRQRQHAELSRFRDLSKSEYESWRAEDERRFRDFSRDVARQWGEYVGSTSRTWVEYGENAKSRSMVDFKKGVVTVQVLADKARAGLPEVKKDLERAVTRVVASRGSSGTTPEAANSPAALVLAQPVLTNQVIDENGAAVSPQNAGSFAKRIVDENPPMAARAGDSTVSYTVSFPLAPDHLVRRMTPFVPVVKKYCATYDLNPAQVLAIIHTESYFNPMARSPAHAIGLMQLVPEKGAAEAYQFVAGGPGAPVLTQESLFDPDINIRLGCAYLYLLKTRDFGDVTNKDCGMYCSIAGYNGGPASVAYAFTGDYKMQRAIRSINSMNDADKVYLFLVRNLPSVETRNYLENVVQRTRLYE
jgi:membrane-bound lytic murein transglycosylase C